MALLESSQIPFCQCRLAILLLMLAMAIGTVIINMDGTLSQHESNPVVRSLLQDENADETFLKFDVQINGVSLSNPSEDLVVVASDSEYNFEIISLPRTTAERATYVQIKNAHIQLQPKQSEEPNIHQTLIPILKMKSDVSEICKMNSYEAFTGVDDELPQQQSHLAANLIFVSKLNGEEASSSSRHNVLAKSDWTVSIDLTLAVISGEEIVMKKEFTDAYPLGVSISSNSREKDEQETLSSHGQPEIVVNCEAYLKPRFQPKRLPMDVQMFEKIYKLAESAIENMTKELLQDAVEQELSGKSDNRNLHEILTPSTALSDKSSNRVLQDIPTPSPAPTASFYPTITAYPTASPCYVCDNDANSLVVNKDKVFFLFGNQQYWTTCGDMEMAGKSGLIPSFVCPTAVLDVKRYCICATPTEAPIPTTRPSRAPISRRPTREPSPAPVSQPPSPAPTTKSPSPAPITQRPSPAPATESPSPAPITQQPSPAPSTESPSPAPIQPVPSLSPITEPPSPAPTTTEPSTNKPSKLRNIFARTYSPTSPSPTSSPTNPMCHVCHGDDRYYMTETYETVTVIETTLECYFLFNAGLKRLIPPHACPDVISAVSQGCSCKRFGNQPVHMPGSDITSSGDHSSPSTTDTAPSNALNSEPKPASAIAFSNVPSSAPAEESENPTFIPTLEPASQPSITVPIGINSDFPSDPPSDVQSDIPSDFPTSQSMDVLNIIALQTSDAPTLTPTSRQVCHVCEGGTDFEIRQEEERDTVVVLGTPISCYFLYKAGIDGEIPPHLCDVATAVVWKDCVCHKINTREEPKKDEKIAEGETEEESVNIFPWQSRVGEPKQTNAFEEEAKPLASFAHRCMFLYSTWFALILGAIAWFL